MEHLLKIGACENSVPGKQIPNLGSAPKLGREFPVKKKVTRKAMDKRFNIILSFSEALVLILTVPAKFWSYQKLGSGGGT